ncbi:MAG: hypothetical protein WKF30_04215 [Pyrinomonadaceae bacterium]
MRRRNQAFEFLIRSVTGMSSFALVVCRTSARRAHRVPLLAGGRA